MQYAMNGRMFRVAGVAIALAVTLQGCASTPTLRLSRVTPGHNAGRTQAVNRWENVAALVGGTSLRVRLVDGRSIVGTLESVSADRVAVKTDGGHGTVAWRRDEVQRVDERRRPRLGSGAGWGALAGFLGGVIGLKLIPAKDSVANGIYFNHELPSLALATGIGVGTGLTINAARRRWVVVYQRP